MSNDWRAFLSAQGAEFEGDMVRFNAEAKEISTAANGTVLLALTQLGLVRVHGSDSSGFLQGQLSNDINALNPRRSQLSAYCTPKGRMLAQLRIIPRAENDYWLILSRQLLESTVKRLRMYVLRSDVTLEDVSDQHTCLGLAGADAEKLLNDAYPTVPAATNEVCQHDQDTLIRIPDPAVPRFLVMAPSKRAQALWQRWSAQIPIAGSRAWEWLDIRAGLPSIVPETVEEFVPLMLNLQHLDGVSFKKGCYPGQEIIARTHYLGKVKRRMYRAHSEQLSPPAPGTDIYDDQSGGQSVGKVVNAQASPDGGVDLLAVLQVSAEQGELHLGEAAGPTLQLQPLPYSLEEAS